MSNANPEGHRSASNPWTLHRTTSRQSSSAVRRKYSDGGRPLHSSASFSADVVASACLLTIDPLIPVTINAMLKLDQVNCKHTINKYDDQDEEVLPIHSLIVRSQ